MKFDNTKNRARGRDKIISRAFPAWYGIALLMYIKLIRPKPDEECEEVFIDCQRRRPIASLDFRAYIHSKYNEYKALTFGDRSPPQYVGNTMKRKIMDTIFRLDSFNRETAEHSRKVSESTSVIIPFARNGWFWPHKSSRHLLESKDESAELKQYSTAGLSGFVLTCKFDAYWLCWG